MLPCSGGTIDLWAEATAGELVMQNDFDNGNAGPGWSSTSSAQFNNPCDPSFDGGTYMWMGDAAAHPREIESQSFDVSCGGEICFWLDFATQGDPSPCEGIDLDHEGVYFQYSTNNGASWTTIEYFGPNGVGDSTTNAGTDPQMTSWNEYCFNIPPAAQTPNTSFRWLQDGSSGSVNDHWGIDNVIILGASCDHDYDWQHVAGVPNDSDQTVTVNSDTTFTACYTNIHNGGSDSCCTDIFIDTEGIDSLSFDTILESCDKDDDGEITVNTHGGTGPYLYQMSGPVNDTDSTASFTGLPDGDYHFQVIEDGGCTASDSITLIAGPNCCSIVHDSTTTEDVTCYGAGDGTATVYASGGPTPYQYRWFDGAGNPIGQSSQTATGLTPGTYIVGVMDQDSCTISDTVSIAQPDGPWYVGTSHDSSFCSQPDGAAHVDSVYGNEPPYSYQWDASTGNQIGSSANNLTPGSYSVTVTGAEGCDTTLSVTVPNVSGQTVSIAGQTDVSCFGGSDGEATAQVNGGTAPYTYQWNDPANQSTQTATGLSAGSYQVMVTDANGCQDSAQVIISEPSPLSVTTVPDTTICIGGTATISANGSGGTPPYTFHWDNGLGTGQAHNVSPGSNTIYNVYVEDANGCTSSDASVRVQLHPSLSVDAFSDDSICPGKSSNLAAAGSGGSGQGYTYSWSNGDQGVSTTVSPGNSTTYTVTLEDNCETPAATDNVDIHLYELPDVDIGGVDLEGCAPVQPTLINETPDSMVGSQCVWDFGDGEQGTGCDSIQHQYAAPGCYDVGLTVRSPEGCVDSSMAQSFVCVRPYPDAAFDYQPDEATVQDPSFDFQDLSSGASDHAWDFAGLDSSYEANPSYSFPADGAGEYQVCLEASSQYGCKDTTCRTVVIQGEMIIYVPNAFTPDGDGVNDAFYPEVQGVDPRDYHFYVYDRWGEIVFETHSPEGKWDGSIKGSQSAAKPDVYVWRLVTKNKYTGDKVEKKGHVTLLR